MSSPPRRFQPWLLLSLFWVAAGTGTAAAAGPQEKVLARYQGGELRASELKEDLRGLDPERRAAAICAGVYREIYGRQARRAGIAERPEFQQELEKIARRLAAATYRKKRQPNFEMRLKDAEVEEEWRRRSRPGGDLYDPGVADMDVLFLRCGTLTQERKPCWARAAEIDHRLREGEPFAEIVNEERLRSGNANGSYAGAPLARLAADLRELALRTQRQTFSPWLEAPHGLFRLQVLARRGAAPRPLAEVEKSLRLEMAETRLREWEAAERRRLAPKSKDDIDEVLAQAAEQAGDTQEAAYLEQLGEEKDRLLARWSLLADRAARPQDAELEAQRQARSAELEELVLLIFFLPAGDGAYATAGEIAETLTRGAGQLPATLAALPTRFADLRVEQVGPLRLRQIEATLPELGKSLAGAAAGTWRGPIPLESQGLWHLLHKEGEGAGGNSLAFVAVLQRTVPPLSVLRSELLEPFVHELESGGPLCHDVLKRLFALEILPAEP